ncbi:MAG: L,D-transpeptidase family protein [Bacteroidales bacterium]|jgi:murein L,D-transpeptidase YcbB/YkuD|nr:L,D-transpeptidase family protein [Bacteroidales bacterium]
MKKIIFTALIWSLASISGADELSESISQFINNKPADLSYVMDQENLYSVKAIQNFYRNRNYAPAWINSKAPVWINSNIPPWINASSPVRMNSDSPAWIKSDIPVWINSNVLGKNGYVLLDYIRQIARHGLNPSDYHLFLLEKYVDKTKLFMAMDTEDMMKLDVLLTDAYLLLGLHLYYGKVDSEKEGENWTIQRKKPELQLNRKLEEALTAGDITNGLNLLAPRYRSYWMMKEDLAFFLELENEPWPAIISDTTINPAQSNQLLPKIRRRLIKLRYSLSDSISVTYDTELEKQLKNFQKDWGLNADGVIGKGTLLALNTRPEMLINRLKVNMERFRWLPLHEPRKYLMVNIASFDLVLIEGVDTLISMRAIVGKDYRETPVFNALMTYIVFGPSWTVPPTILKNDVIPELLKGPEYLKKKNMKLLRYDGSEIAYSEIDWTKISRNNFPYMVRQNPGAENALGKVKFMFPNSYNVYIHDTPSRGYFARDDRAMSSGCIRIEKPFELAELLLADSPEWPPEKIHTAMQQNRGQTASLKTPVEVLLLYLTSWTDGNGRVQFRKDIYMWDELIVKALNQKPKTEKIKVIPF